jgi:hypothetical protein
MILRNLKIKLNNDNQCMVRIGSSKSTNGKKLTTCNILYLLVEPQNEREKKEKKEEDREIESRIEREREGERRRVVFERVREWKI